jgi:hypothetical protein
MDNTFIKNKIKEALYNDKVNNSFDKIISLIRIESKKLNDDDSFELHEKLKEWFNKLLETTIIDKTSNINDPSLKQKNPETVKKALDIAKKTSKPVTIIEDDENIIKLNKILNNIEQNDKEIKNLYKKHQNSDDGEKKNIIDKLKRKINVKKELIRLRNQNIK